MTKFMQPFIVDNEINLESLKDIPSNVPLRDIVFQNLKKAILDGTLKPGQFLSENKIASKLSVSRTPVREALRSLEIENLVTVLTGRRIIVSIPTVQDIEDNYQIRLIVESEALRRIRPDQHMIFERLEQCVKMAEIHLANHDIHGLRQNNNEFHQTIISALENNKLNQIIESLQDTLSRFRLYALTDKEWAKDSKGEHHQIIEHLKQGDTEAAIAILRQHLATSKQVLINILHPAF